MAKLNQGIFGEVQPAIGNNLGAAAGKRGNPSLPGVAVGVSINGAAMPAEYYTVNRFNRSLGGQRVDQAILTAERVRGSLQLYLQNGPLRPEEHGAKLEIYSGKNRVFWGIVEDADYEFGDESDNKIIVASIQPWHFAPPVAAAQYLHISRDTDGRTQREVVMATEPIVFNGFVDPSKEFKGKQGQGYFVGNCAHLGRFKPKKRDGNEVAHEANMLVPLEVLQTESGQQRYVDEWRAYDERSRWTIRSAARYLCAIANYETLIANPKDKDYDTLPDTPLPRTEMPVGAMLPQMLDTLLTPYGCSWYVDVDGTDNPRIKFVEFGKGVECEAKYAKVGGFADFGSTNVVNANLNYSTAPTINEVHCIGEPLRVEVTVPLIRVSEYKWAFNEAGDYEEDYYGEDADVPDLSDVFPDSILGSMAQSPFVSRIQRRRRFHPTITVSDTITGDVQPKGPHNGFLIEIIDLAQEDVAEASKEWMPIDKITDPMFQHVRVLEDECAIIFDRGLPEDGDEQDQPENFFLKALGPNARMRITASIEADFAGQFVVTREGRSPSVSATSRTFVWHDQKRWPCRRVLTSGTYKSVYGDDEATNKTPTVSQVIEDMEKAAQQVLERTDAAQISGALTFFGLHHLVPLGGVVKLLAGRGVTMGTRYESDSETTASESDNPQYPQIVSVEWSPQSQEIRAMLTVDPGEGLEAIQ